MKVCLIRYNAGNICSLTNALKSFGIEPEITDDHEKIKSADKVIFPGVGEAGSAMAYLKERKLDLLIRSLKQPVLGICIGLQLLCEWSEENNTECIGVFPVKVRKFIVPRKIPHMGWNKLDSVRGKLFEAATATSPNLQADRENGNSPALHKPYVYFVHSFYAEQNQYSIAECIYGDAFAAAMQKDNFWAVQFHPEKSSSYGQNVLHNFLKI
jgi:imidazole glycerol-phosphate synthase subunit HisH